jgi:hypothetical protein
VQRHQLGIRHRAEVLYQRRARPDAAAHTGEGATFVADNLIVGLETHQHDNVVHHFRIDHALAQAKPGFAHDLLGPGSSRVIADAADARHGRLDRQPG